VARDVCVDCKGHFPFGEGLKDGRCPDCAAGLRERRAEARKAAKPAPKRASESKPEPEPESDPEPESEAEEDEEE